MTSVSDLIDEVERRAREAGLDFDRTVDEDGDETCFLTLRNGKNTRSLYLSDFAARVLVESEFEEWVILGNYNAIWDRRDRSVEIELSGASGPGRYISRQVRKIPGVSEYDPPPAQPSLFDDVEGVDAEASAQIAAQAARGNLGNKLWKVPLSTRKYDVELSPASRRIMILKSIPLYVNPTSYPTLKVSNVDFSGHDEALRRIEELASSFVFSFDVCYGIALYLPKIRQDRIARKAKWNESDLPEPELPARTFAYEAASLYSFARSVPSMPLQQFLAYYQAIEHFFPSYWESEIIRRLRVELDHPEFRVSSDAKVNRLVQIAKVALGGRAGGSERNQLLSVVERCVEESELKEFIESGDQRKAAFIKKEVISGIDPISLNEKGSAFIKQVCERIYAIRCRVVHAKEDSGGGDLPAPLLPFTDEASKIGHDIDLVQFVAQKCIIASTVNDAWWR